MSLQYILLGLLADEPGSGYDLNKRLQTEGQHFWTTDQSQIYRALYKMQSEDWVYYETVIQKDSPNKKVYYVTETGRSQLQAWLREDTLENPPANIWMAKLYLGRDLREDEIQHIFRERLEQVKQFRCHTETAYHELKQTMNGHQVYKMRLLTFECNLQTLDCEIGWLQQQLSAIGELSAHG
ncbi:MAG: PadR family transcriptional regulator [Anaerolineae bacterium]